MFKIKNLLGLLLTATVFAFVVGCSEDDDNPIISSDPAQAMVRVIHTSYDAPAVDVTLTDGTVVFGDYEFKEYSAFTPLPAGTYDLQVRAAATDVVVLDLPSITLQDGMIYSVFAEGLLNDSGKGALGAEIIVNN